MELLVRCPRCWKRVPETSRYCRRCGCALTSATPPPLPHSKSNAAAAGEGGGLAALLGLLMMGGMILIGLMLFTAVDQRRCPLAPPPPSASPAPAPDSFQAAPALPDERGDADPQADFPAPALPMPPARERHSFHRRHRPAPTWPDEVRPQPPAAPATPDQLDL